MITKVCFNDSFKVSGCGDFVFTVLDAIADFSESRNGAVFQFPSGYWTNGLPNEAWMGFFLKELSVTFPKELDLNKKKNKNAQAKFSNVLIDDYGFTGLFLLTDMIDTKGGNDRRAEKGKRVHFYGVLHNRPGVFLESRA